MLPHRSRKHRCNDPNGTAKAIGKESIVILSGEENIRFHCRSIVMQIPING